jgi:hypothetical protein
MQYRTEEGVRAELTERSFAAAMLGVGAGLLVVGTLPVTGPALIAGTAIAGAAGSVLGWRTSRTANKIAELDSVGRYSGRWTLWPSV